MTTAAELDIESIVIGAALADVDYMAAIGAGTGVGTRLRREWTSADPAVRIRRVGGLPHDRTGWTVDYRLQVDTFAATEPEAFALAVETARWLDGLAGRTVAGAVIAGVDHDIGLANSPDPDSDAERYIVGVTLIAHPTP